jgi:hypothetical protein
VEERAKRTVMDAKAAEKKAKKAAKKDKDVASVVLEVEGGSTDTTKRGRKRKITALAAAAVPKAKVARTSKVQVAGGGQHAGGPEPSAKAARRGKGPEPSSSTATQAEDGAALEPWSAPVARMW